MATLHLATAVKTSALTAIRDAIDAGAGAGTVKIYTGTIPTDANTAVGAQVLLGTLTFPYPCTTAPGSMTAGVLTAGTIVQDSSADATGTATWARIADSTGATVMDIDVSATGGTGALQMNTAAIVAAGPILISSFIVTIP